MKLTQLLGERAEAEVEFPGGKIVIGYRPGVLTPRYLDAGRTISDALADCVLDWPLETDAGEPIPATAEGLADVPMEVQEQVYIGILRSRRPNLQRAETSPENSSNSA